MAMDESTKVDDLLNMLEEQIGDSKDKAREFALKLIDREKLKPVSDPILKKGRTTRTADVETKASETLAALTEARDELAEAKRQIQELQAKEPNWSRRLEEESRKWEKKLEEAKAEAVNERRTGLMDRVERERQKFISALRIGQEDGVEEGYGSLIPAQYAAHFVPDEEKRQVKVLELGEKDAYYDPAEGDPAEQLARDVLAKVPPKYRILGEPSPGGGTQNGGRIDKATAAIVAAKRSDPLYGAF